ncbi:thymine dioxygenase [Mycena pura]|uniref:Thymine dioxygenase n=1 Tax=Mycena pura TaxID=153505 RepID=A0AAD6VLA1_9AGAR|nr:thymine dioxygenase [Mycena pura]
MDVVDLGGFRDGTSKQAVADAILQSFTRVGFVYLKNYGLSPQQVATMFAVSKEFFALPLELKQLAPHPPSGAHHRGYSSPGQEKILNFTIDGDILPHSRPVAPDVKEHFECGHEGNDGMPNIWLPDGVLPGFRETCLEFYRVCHSIELEICRALAVALRLPEDYFARHHTAADNQLRLLHYPSVPAEDLQNETIQRISQHSDYGTITLLFQDDTGGLEIEDPGVPGLFRARVFIIVSSSSLILLRWPADAAHTRHNHCQYRRLSAAMCVVPRSMCYDIPRHAHRAERHDQESHPSRACAARKHDARRDGPREILHSIDSDSVVDCAPGTWDAERPKKYEPTSPGEYSRRRLAAAY